MSLLKVNTLTDLGGDAPTIPPYAGQILQVVSTTKTDVFQSASTTFADITGLSVSITPSSDTSKILVTATIHGSALSQQTQCYFRLARGGAAIGVGDAVGSRIQVSGDIGAVLSNNDIGSSAFSFLDSPSSTSALTYNVQLRNQGSGTVLVNRSSSDTDSAVAGRTTSTITVMEVAG